MTWSLSLVLMTSCTSPSNDGNYDGSPPANNIAKTEDWIPSQAKSVLWVGAHPDDEVYVAPILAELCKDKKMDCHLLVMTDGGKGNCNLAEGCSPSVAEVRNTEMQMAAQYFNATLEKPNFEDSPAGTPDGVLEAWNQQVGGGTKLTDSLTNYVAKIKPDIVLTFDPRHGSSCHLDHRAIGRLVMATVLKVKGNLDSVFFPQAVWTTGVHSPTQIWAGNEVVIPSDKNVFFVDAVNFWNALIDIFKIHKSQFQNQHVDAFQLSPNANRTSPLLKASNTDMADPLYQNLCPVNDARWPGR